MRNYQLSQPGNVRLQLDIRITETIRMIDNNHREIITQKQIELNPDFIMGTIPQETHPNIDRREKMYADYCPGCMRGTGHKRRFGIGTIVMLVMTMGWWILAMPFYPKRCVICGLKPR